MFSGGEGPDIAGGSFRTAMPWIIQLDPLTPEYFDIIPL